MDFNLVIPAYQRLHSLKRLLLSVANLQFKGNINIWISCDGGSSNDVLSFVNSYKWDGGTYTIIMRDENLGVDRHILQCMRMVEDLDHIVLLEDDLSLSPFALGYLEELCAELQDDEAIAGISLYRYPVIEAYHYPFSLIPNEEFVYYQQRPSANGCFYSREMLLPFLDYNKTFADKFDDYHLPSNVLKWDDEVWEKTFYTYLVSHNKYLAFPRFSLSTDWGDPGVHMKAEVNKFVHHSPLYLSSDFFVKRITDTLNVYDAFYELLPDKLRPFIPELKDSDFEMDLYGQKDISKTIAEMLISQKPCSESVRSWGRFLKPEINNILLGSEGNHYRLASAESFGPQIEMERLRADYLYYYPDISLNKLIRMKWEEILSRFI